MLQGRKKILKIVSRIVSTLILIAGLWLVPWAIVFGTAIFFGSFFSWYFEILALGFLSAVIAGIASWQLIAILSIVLFAQEFLKLYLEHPRWISHAVITTGGIGILIVSSFIFL